MSSGESWYCCLLPALSFPDTGACYGNTWHLEEQAGKKVLPSLQELYGISSLEVPLPYPSGRYELKTNGLDTISGGCTCKGLQDQGEMFWKYQLSQHLDKVWAGHSLNSEGCRHSTGVVSRKTWWQREADCVDQGHALGTALQSHAKKMGRTQCSLT